MDELTGKLNQILSDPQSMAQIQNIMSSMGLGGQSSAPSAPASADISPAAAPAVPEPEIAAALTGLMPLLSNFRKEDDTTRLLSALRPLLSDARQKKVDEAMKILRIIRIIPMVKNTGILSSIF